MGTTSGAPGRRLTPEEQLAAASRYAAGESSVAVGASIGCSHRTVLNAVRSAGGRVRAHTRRVALNVAAFDTWTDESMYWAGLLAADGCVGDNCYISLALKEEDADHIYRFRSFLKSGHKVQHVSNSQGFGSPHSRSARMTFRSPEVLGRLRAAGLRQRNQSDVAEPLASSPAFWAGVVDGDGSIADVERTRHVSVSLVGGFRLVGQFLSFAIGLSPRCGSHVLRHKSIWSVHLGGSTAAAVLAAMYATAGPRLSRKQERATRAIAFHAARQAQRAAAEAERQARTCLTAGCGRRPGRGGFCGLCWRQSRKPARLSVSRWEPRAWYNSHKGRWFYYPPGKKVPRSLGVRGKENEAAARAALDTIRPLLATDVERRKLAHDQAVARRHEETRRVCRQPDCGRLVYARGLCGRCYQQNRRRHLRLVAASPAAQADAAFRLQA